MSDVSEQGDDLELVDPGPVFREGETDRLVADALSRLHADDDSGRRAYGRAVGLLRERTPEVVETVARAEEAAPPGSYPLRWALYYLLADLQDVRAIPQLVRAATREIPRGEFAEESCERPEDGEVLVSVMAVESLERLAGVDRRRSVEALLHVVEAQPHVAIRRAAAHAVLSAEPDARERVRALLPEEQRFLLDRRRARVEELTARVDDPKGEGERPAAPAPRLSEDSTAPRIAR